MHRLIYPCIALLLLTLATAFAQDTLRTRGADTGAYRDTLSATMSDSIRVNDTNAMNAADSSDSITPDALPVYGGKDTAGAGDSAINALSVNKPAGSDTIRAFRKVMHDFKAVGRFFGRYLNQILMLGISCCIIIFTIMFFRRKDDLQRFMTSTRLSVMDREVQRACKYLEVNYADPDLTVEKICETLVTGPAFLEALFDRELGMNITRFLTHVRIHRTQQIVQKNPSITPDELIVQIGYTDNETFMQMFKTITHVSFEDYRSSLPQSR